MEPTREEMEQQAPALEPGIPTDADRAFSGDLVEEMNQVGTDAGDAGVEASEKWEEFKRKAEDTRPDSEESMADTWDVVQEKVKKAADRS